jgi:raffinose/stachyose/melibiose transport system permease protein
MDQVNPAMVKVRSRRLRRINSAVANISYISPALIIYVVLVIVPGIMSILYSFTDFNGVDRSFHFVGVSNYLQLFRDRVFWISLKNNFIYLVFNGALQNTISLLYALALNQHVRGYKLYRAIIFFPYVLTPVGVGIAFIYLLHPVYGVIKTISNVFPLARIAVNILGNPNTVVFGIGSVQIWLSMGVMVTIWLAGIQNLDQDCLAAAQIDGANRLQTLFKVTIPLLIPSIVVVTILTIVGNFKAYDLPWSMTAGGPGYSSYFTSIFIFKTAFEYYRFNYAMCASAIIFVLPLVLIIAVFLVIRKKYDFYI